MNIVESNEGLVGRYVCMYDRRDAVFAVRQALPLSKQLSPFLSHGCVAHETLLLNLSTHTLSHSSN